MYFILKIKNIILSPLLKLVLRYPGVMESALFMKIMSLFPAKVSTRYEKRITNMGAKYSSPLKEGIKLLKGFKPGKALDLATGTGFAAIELANNFPQAEIHGIDLSEEMLDKARAKAKNGEYNVHFVKGNAAQLDYENGSFDLVMTSNAPVYLREIYRVLKENGLLLVTYSFGGNAFIRNKDGIANFLQKYNLKLLALKTVEDGVVILGQK